LQGTLYEGHKSQVYISRGSIWRERGDWDAAIADYERAVAISKQIVNYRGITDAGGLLAQSYEHVNNLPEALDANKWRHRSQHQGPVIKQKLASDEHLDGGKSFTVHKIDYRQAYI
jgi:hypothetical protein